MYRKTKGVHVYRKTKGVDNVCIGRRKEYKTCVQEDEGSTQRMYRKTKGVDNMCTGRRSEYTTCV